MRQKAGLELNAQEENRTQQQQSVGETTIENTSEKSAEELPEEDREPLLKRRKQQIESTQYETKEDIISHDEVGVLLLQKKDETEEKTDHQSECNEGGKI